MRRFPVRVPLPLLWPKSSSKFVCKINEGVNLHPLQVVYKNNSITRRLSGFRERFEETILSRDTVIYLLRNLRFVINLNESVLQPKQSTEFLGDDNRLSGDESVAASGESRVDFKKVSGYVVNAG